MRLKSKKKDLVILAGGKGSRVKNYLNKLPKPMVKINGIPFLKILIQHYSRYDLNKIYILAGYRGKIIRDTFHKKKFNFVDVECIIEKKPMDTFGCLYSIKKKLNDFYIVNGDSFLDFNLANLKIQKNKIASIAIVKNTNYLKNNKLSNLKIIKNNLVSYAKRGGLMNAGVYYFKKEILNYVSNQSKSLEKNIIPLLIKNKLLCGYYVNSKKFIDIGTPKNLSFIIKNYSYFFKKPGVFLDRDGVINYDKGYTYRIKDFKFKTGVIEGLKKLIENNFYLFIVTNQAGIAKKKYKLQDFINLQQYIKTYLSNKNIYFDDVKFCPFHPDSKIKKYKKNSKYRKPGNLMIEQIFKERVVDRSKSFMIGDKITDFICANKSGIKFYYTQSNFKKLILSILNK